MAYIRETATRRAFDFFLPQPGQWSIRMKAIFRFSGAIRQRLSMFRIRIYTRTVARLFEYLDGLRRPSIFQT